MKKCPKCGTVLDDNKKKCYMCGADLAKSKNLDFMNNFNNQVGAAVTKGQDNVFNNGSTITVKVNEVGKNDSNNVTFSNTTSTADFFKKQMGSTDEFHDNRTAIEKMFSSDSRYNSKNVVNSNNLNFNNFSNNNVNNRNNTTNVGSNGINSFKQNNNSYVPPNNVSSNSVSSGNVPRNNIFPKKEKPAINWGNNLTKNTNNNVSSYKDSVSKKFNLNFSFIFNTTCFILFVIAFIFVYFKFIRTGNSDIKVGGLSYTIGKNFKLKSEDNSSKYYTYGEDCVVRIGYGDVSNVDSFNNDYFDNVQNTYRTEDGFITQQNKMKVNDNTWSEIIVSELQDNPASSSGYSTVSKYRFVTIVYKGNYYEIRYVNLNDDNVCSSMYEDLVESLKFD